MTSSSDPTPSLIASSVAKAYLFIVPLFFVSFGPGICSGVEFTHRNISTVQHPPPVAHLLSPHSSSAADAKHLSVTHHWRRKKAASADDAEKKIACYSCTYLYEEDYKMESYCNDPFNGANVPEVMCHGSCHKVMKKLASGGMMIVRGCLPKCREKVDDKGYTRCCKTRLCNRSTSLNSTHRIVTVLWSALLCFVFASATGFSV